MKVNILETSGRSELVSKVYYVNLSPDGYMKLSKVVSFLGGWGGVSSKVL